MVVRKREYHTRQDLDMWLEQLHVRMEDAVKAKDAMQSQACAYNIVHVMREVEKLKADRENGLLKFKLRDIIRHAESGNLSPEDALERLKKLV